jgi:hypothetical protein
VVVAVGGSVGVAGQVAVRERRGHLGTQALEPLEALLAAVPVRVGWHPAMVAIGAEGSRRATGAPPG